MRRFSGLAHTPPGSPPRAAARGEGVEDEIEAIGEVVAQVFVVNVRAQRFDGFRETTGIPAHPPDEMALAGEQRPEGRADIAATHDENIRHEEPDPGKRLILRRFEGGNLAAEDALQMMRHDAQTGVERAELAVPDAGLIEAHLVYEALEDERVF